MSRESRERAALGGASLGGWGVELVRRLVAAADLMQDATFGRLPIGRRLPTGCQPVANLHNRRSAKKWMDCSTKNRRGLLRNGWIVVLVVQHSDGIQPG